MSTSSAQPTTTSVGDQVDVRGPRFAASITTAVLVAVLVATAFSTGVAGAILAVQTLRSTRWSLDSGRRDTTAYDGGHIDGAVKLDWKEDLQDGIRRDSC